MLYSLMKIWSRGSLRLFCRTIVVNKPEWLRERGPLLLACNHPNSFLDSVILNTLFERPVWSLARGDVFRNRFYTRLLTALRILPVYRTSEGTDKLAENYRTFEACIVRFRRDAIVTIYSEAKCVNEWHLRPLRKGTARLALRAWADGIPLRVLPVGINYSSFRRFGKNVFLNFGTPITIADIPLEEADGTRHQAFNDRLASELRNLVYEIPLNDRSAQQRLLTTPVPPYVRALLLLPGFAGWLLHAPLYLPIKQLTRSRTLGTDHYDSVLVALLLVSYPFYCLLITLLVREVTGSDWAWLLVVALPFLVWCRIWSKSQTN